MLVGSSNVDQTDKYVIIIVLRNVKTSNIPCSMMDKDNKPFGVASSKEYKFYKEYTITI